MRETLTVVDARSSGPCCLLGLLGLLALAQPVAPAGAEPPAPAAEARPDADPWAALAEVRRRLAAGGPWEARFEQLFVPAGFTEGERETGRLALSLPDCLRWDYDPPSPKSFLVCGDLLHAWNPQDQTGQRRAIDGRNEPGLDLLLLGLGELRSRYRATVEGGGREALRVHLARLGGEEAAEPAAVREATLTLDLDQGVVSGLEYLDAEGNHTRFILSGYGRLPATDLFAPPANVTWEEPPEPP